MIIDSIKNPLIKEILGLKKRKNRWEEHLFIVEGPKMVSEALDKNYPIKFIIHREGFHHKRLRELKTALVSEKLMNTISETEMSQGVMAVCPFQNILEEDVYVWDQYKTALFLNKIQDPGNLGTIIRSADAFGIELIILEDGCVDPFNPKVVRASMGAIFRTKFMFVKEDRGIQDIKKAGVKIVGAEKEGRLPIKDIEIKDKTCLVIGNESRGISDSIRAVLDETVVIPMRGETESLNASVAASILMYELMNKTNYKDICVEGSK